MLQLMVMMMIIIIITATVLVVAVVAQQHRYFIQNLYISFADNPFTIVTRLQVGQLRN
jgi:hypothetical protein